MKTILAIFILLLLIHLMAAVGFVGWLKATDRISNERLMQVVDTFKPTLESEAAAKAEAEAAEAIAREAAEKLMKLEAVSKGPKTVEDRLAENFQADEFDLHRLERLRNETEAIQRRLEQDKALIAQQLAELEAKQVAFDEAVAKRTLAVQDEDFQRAVKTLEQLPPKQAKQMIQQYLAAGKMKEAVDYLAAMQMRKSAGILKAFKDGPDVAQASLLLEELRTRGIDMPDTESRAAAEPAEQEPRL